MMNSQFLESTAGDRLLESKAHKELIYSYEARLQHVSEFVTSMNPKLKQTFLPLLDPTVPSRAETSNEVTAIVVSGETIPGAHSINASRKQRGLPPLLIVVVPVLEAMAGGRDKLSSTALRAKDAENIKSA